MPVISRKWVESILHLCAQLRYLLTFSSGLDTLDRHQSEPSSSSRSRASLLCANIPKPQQDPAASRYAPTNYYTIQTAGLGLTRI